MWSAAAASALSAIFFPSDLVTFPLLYLLSSALLWRLFCCLACSAFLSSSLLLFLLCFTLISFAISYLLCFILFCSTPSLLYCVLYFCFNPSYFPFSSVLLSVFLCLPVLSSTYLCSSDIFCLALTSAYVVSPRRDPRQPTIGARQLPIQGVRCHNCLGRRRRPYSC